MVLIIKPFYTYTHPCVLLFSKYTTIKRVGIGLETSFRNSALILTSSPNACPARYFDVSWFVIFYHDPFHDTTFIQSQNLKPRFVIQIYCHTLAAQEKTSSAT